MDKYAQENSNILATLCQELLAMLAYLEEGCVPQLPDKKFSFDATISCADELLKHLRKPGADVFQFIWRARLLAILQEDPQLYAHILYLLRGQGVGGDFSRRFVGLVLLLAVACFGVSHVRQNVEWLGMAVASPKGERADSWEWDEQLLPLSSWLVVPGSWELPPSSQLSSPFASRAPVSQDSVPVRVVHSYSP